MEQVLVSVHAGVCHTAQMKSIPFGAWFGIAIVLLAAWAKDVMGIIVGVILIAITTIAVRRRQAAADAAGPGEPYDDGI